MIPAPKILVTPCLDCQPQCVLQVLPLYLAQHAAGKVLYLEDVACEHKSLVPRSAACCRNHPTHFWNQYCVLQRRALQAYTRNPLNVAGRTMMAIFIGILGGLVFMKDVHGES